MPTVTDHAADIQNVADTVRTSGITEWSGTTTTKLALIASDSATSGTDIDGRIKRVSIDPRGGARAMFAAAWLAIARLLFGAVLRQLAVTLDYSWVTPDSPEVTILRGLRKYMLDNSKVFKSRGVTHNAVAAGGGNTGSGELKMHTADDYGFTLEGVSDEELTFTCESDATTGTASGEEVFHVVGEAVEPDFLAVGGSTIDTRIASTHAGNNEHVANANFAADWSGSGVDKIPGWTVEGTASNIAQETTKVFRDGSSIKFDADEVVYADITDLPTDRPVLINVKASRNGTGADGTFGVKVGGATRNDVTVSSQHASNFFENTQVLWPRQWAGTPLRIELEVTGGATWGLVAGEVNVVPMTRIGGRWFATIAGETDFTIDDEFTQDTEIAGTGTNKDMLHRVFGNDVEFPHNGTASSGWED
ncbi:MAG: hypothetical protein AB7F99_09485 [Vicinamibacterales bacterium]